MRRKLSRRELASLSIALFVVACASEAKRTHGVTKVPTAAAQLTVTPGGPVVRVAGGYEVEPFARGLDLPAAIAFDPKGNAYVVEAGGWSGLNAGRTPPRIVRITPAGELTTIELKGTRVVFPATGIAWAAGGLFVSHRDDRHRGVISRVELDGTATPIVRDLPSQGDHGTNQIVTGPDGKLYFSQGNATNSGVVGLDDFLAFGWPEIHPEVHDVPARSLILAGRNFLTDDPRGQIPDRQAVTGSFKPFGAACDKGDEVKGDVRSNGSILRCNLDGSALEVYAWGLGEPFGLAFSPEGRLHATCQGMELRGSRPIADDVDALLRISQDQWYGWPDFSADLRPLLDDESHAPPKELGLPAEPIVDLGRSSVSTPSRRDLAARLGLRAGASGLAWAPDGFGRYRGKVFVAETGPLASSGSSALAGCAVRVLEESGFERTFLSNEEPGPASRVGALGRGLERPVDAKFGPDGALYVVDLGVVVVAVDPMTGFSCLAREGTGAVWRVKPVGSDVQQP